MLLQIADQLLPVLEAEERHIQAEHTVWFRRELYERVICDRCRATLFAGATLCIECGREWCAQCRSEGATCLPDHPSNIWHVCRFESADELRSSIDRMKEVIRGVKRSKGHAQPQNHRRIRTLTSPTDGFDNWHTWMTHLRDGVPLVVTGCTESMARSYDPQYFADVLRGQKITVVHIADPGREEQKDAYAFFTGIQAGDPETSSWKIKDFPPHDAFKTLLGPMADDLERCWPFLSYVAATGPLNLMSRSPINDGVPKSDVGPKLYNSPAIPVHLGKASTALHMDMMDAVNINLWGEGDGSALWYIFPADKVDTLRNYLNERYKDDPNVPSGDIIHSQRVVFNDEMLRDLQVKTYLVPWVIRQRPGDMVFVPSRCPHMVRNEAWAIKTAIDFMSGAALDRTARVAEELRQYRFVDEDQDDVLQLHLVLWHAWVSLSREMENNRKLETGKRRVERDTTEERAAKARRL